MESDIVDELRERAMIRREGGAEQTATLLDEGADEIERLRAELAAAISARDEAHGLIANWREWLVDTFEHDVVGTYAKAKSNCMCGMSDSDKRALLAATAKKGGGA
jgi:hypothetical protein